MTQSGGAGVLMADRAEELGLAVPELASETQAALSKVVPAFGAVRNPVDITAQFIADPGLLRASLDLVLADPGRYRGFVRQEDFPLVDVLANRFGRHYATGGSKDVSARAIASGQTGHQRLQAGAC